MSTGLSESDAGALGVVVTEAATNLLKHGGGAMILQDLGNAVEIIALDKGPGMSNVGAVSWMGIRRPAAPVRVWALSRGFPDFTISFQSLRWELCWRRKWDRGMLPIHPGLK